MKTHLSSIILLLARHKIVTCIGLLLLAGGGYWGYSAYTSTAAETRYVLGVVKKGTIIASISGTGQVAASNQIDIKPKVSGDIVSLHVKAGQTVKQGQVIATIDSTDARQAVTNAQIDLHQSQLTLEQDTAQAPIDYDKTQQAVGDAKSSLDDAYESAYTSISDAFVALPAVMSEADNLLHDADVSPNAQNVNAYENLFINADQPTQSTIRASATRATDDYTRARDAYTSVYAHFKTLSRSSPSSDVEQALNDSENAVKLISQALTSEVNLIDNVVDQINLRDWTLSTAITTQQSSAHAQLTAANAVLSNLSSEVQSLRAAKKALTVAQQDLQVASIGNPNGTSPFSLQFDTNDVAKKEAALRDAEQSLADHSVRAPFDGVVATLEVDAYQSVTSGTAIATLITTQKTAVLSLNEVDAAKVAVGDKATLTFDAFDSLTLTGEVAEIDTVGAVTQGVVSYAVTIAFDTQDDRVKPGMTVNASIITDVKQDILTIPSSAVKAQGDVSYVQVFTPPLSDASNATGVTSSVAPQQVSVVMGISDDTTVEVVSGLQEGQQIVTRTISGAATSLPTTNNQGGFRGPGGGIRL